jgi:steroid delta-isomerase-like uncharacterized protein
MMLSRARTMLLLALILSFVFAGCQQQPPGAVTRQQAEAMGNIYTQARNEHNPDMLNQVYLPDVVVHDPMVAEPIQGLDALKQYYERSQMAFPNLKISLDDLYVDGDHVIWVWTFTGTNTGPMGDTPPTGKSVTFKGVAIDKISNGKIAEEWLYFNALVPYTQLGMTVAPPAPAEK